MLGALGPECQNRTRLGIGCFRFGNRACAQLLVIGANFTVDQRGVYIDDPNAACKGGGSAILLHGSM